MTIVQTEDNRNQEWRDSNVGSKMLAKMGWTEGSGIGKRNVNTTALRAVKRQEGLGIGAKRQTEGGNSESTGTFAAVLANLKAHHGTPVSAKKHKSSKKEAKTAKKAAKKAAKKKRLSLPQNKVLAGHARKMREAKFGAKSAQDLACIFGNSEVVDTAIGGAAGAAASSFSSPLAATTTGGSSSSSSSGETAKKKKKRPRSSETESEGSSSSSSSEAEEDSLQAKANASATSEISDQSPAEKKRKKEKKKDKDDKKSKKEKKSKKDKKKRKSKSD
jgi:hypothetical protein